MKHRVALVTGATQGLGHALVAGLASRLGSGDTVYLTGRDRDRTSRAVARLAGGRSAVRAESLDVGNDCDVQRVAALVADRHGGIDVVFSNAYHRVSPSDDPARVVADYVNVNNVGTTRVLRSFGPLVRPGGRLIVVANTMGTLQYLPQVLHAALRCPRFAAGRRPRDTCLARRRPGWFVARRGLAGVHQYPRKGLPGRRCQDARPGAPRGRSSPRHPGRLGLPQDDRHGGPWFDTSNAQTPARAAVPLIDLVLDPRPDPEFYGELVRFGERLPWADEPPATGPRSRPTSGSSG